jgi:hypothetical protein
MPQVLVVGNAHEPGIGFEPGSRQVRSQHLSHIFFHARWVLSGSNPLWTIRLFLIKHSIQDYDRCDVCVSSHISCI